MLYSDSLLQKFENESDSKPQEVYYLKDVCNFFDVDQETRAVLVRPPLPLRDEEDLLVCVPKHLPRKEREIFWISFNSQIHFKLHISLV
jgi:hypothetical protein